MPTKPTFDDFRLAHVVDEVDFVADDEQGRALEARGVQHLVQLELGLAHAHLVRGVDHEHDRVAAERVLGPLRAVLHFLARLVRPGPTPSSARSPF